MENNNGTDKAKQDSLFNESKSALERITFFSDAVMAIAITLLIIEIVLPSATPESIMLDLIDLIPKLFSHVISFFIIGSFWIAHHRIFTYIIRYDSTLLWLNLLFLFFISFLPFPTALLGSYNYIPLVVIIYSITVSLLSISLLMLLIYASHNSRLMRADANPAIIKKMKILNIFNTIGFLLSIPLVFLSVYAAFIMWWSMPIIGIIYRRMVKN